MTERFDARVAPHDLSQLCDSVTWEKYATADGFLEGPNFDAQGQMWVVGVASGAVMRIQDGRAVIVGQPGGLPNGARIGPDGAMIIADIGGSLWRVDLATGDKVQIPTMYQGKALRGLNDLVFDAAGGLYFTEPYGSNVTTRNGRVFYAAPGDLTNLSLFAEGLAFPNGIVLSPDEQWVYVAESSLNHIVKIPAMGAKDAFAFSHVFARMTAGVGPDGLIVDNQGYVYAAHYGAGQVCVFAPDGTHVGDLRLPEQAGDRSTNLVLHEGWLYVTEAVHNEIWRIRVNRKAYHPGRGLQSGPAH